MKTKVFLCDPLYGQENLYDLYSMLYFLVLFSGVPLYVVILACHCMYATCSFLLVIIRCICWCMHVFMSSSTTLCECVCLNIFE